MAIVLWASLRQLEAVRSAFFVSLTQGGACRKLASNTKADLLEWAKQEGIDPQWLLHDSEDTFADSVPETDAGSINRVALAWMRGIRHESGDSYSKAVVEGTLSTASINPGTDYGPERSSAHWDRWENFLTTSAMLRFMATLEQFEIETLKALLYYRPEGTSILPNKCVAQEVQEEVIHEEPEKKGDVYYYKYPALWTWIRPSAEISYQRRQIFSRVYGISFPKTGFDKKHDQLCEMRNAIAHGRKRIDITLHELIQVHGYVTKTMLTIRDTVYERYRLIL